MSEGKSMQLYLKKLIKRQNLSENEAHQATRLISSFSEANWDSEDNRVLSMQAAAFLCLLQAKGETEGELTGIVRGLMEEATKVNFEVNVADITGTGGDGANTVNISTGATVLAAACGVPMAKHGNRAVSSHCGAADVLEALGVKIDLDGDLVVKCLREVGVCFMFAPRFHPVMASLKKIRSALGVPTVFNLIGPLVNPCGARHRVIGVNKREVVRPMAQVLRQLGCGKSVVFHGCGVDELTPLGVAHVIEVNGQNELVEFEFDPEAYGFKKCELKDLEGGDKTCNAKLLESAFEGNPGSISDCLIMNAGMALYVYSKNDTLAECIQEARATLTSGKCGEKMKQWREFVQSEVIAVSE
eukprot:GHVN01044071.1.p1 GENE.GHVN01044071.1~~GHVN01044071.1.p1  ORF type:complete len:382 (-),score=108.79 GHVN01044071.1:130-1203(-)